MTRKTIPGYPDYEVDAVGNVYSLKYGKVRMLKPADNGIGYYRVFLCKEGKQKRHLVHRIVAEAFIENPHNHPQVDHHDGNTLNNRVENLRWVTHQQNQWNRTTAKGYYFHKARGKWQAQIRLDGKTIFLGRFNTEDEARAAYLAAKEKYHIIE